MPLPLTNGKNCKLFTTITSIPKLWRFSTTQKRTEKNLMKIVKVTAYNGIGKAKTWAGERDVEMPTTLEEAGKMFGEEDALEYLISSRTIEVQRQIRTGTTETLKEKNAKLQAEVDKVDKLRAFAAANPESEQAKALTALNIEFMSLAPKSEEPKPDTSADQSS
jgi:hypothetical protein